MIVPADKYYSILRVNPQYCTQPWYHGDDMILLEFHSDRYMPNFGFDCQLKNLRTGEITNLFNKYLIRLEVEDAREVKIDMILTI